MKKKTKIMLAAAAAGAILLPPAYFYLKDSGALHPGNLPKYNPDKVEALPQAKLRNKRIIFLGSSVTYGSAANGISFVEYLQKRDGIVPRKEAVSGTTLVEETVMGKPSYVERLRFIDKNFPADAFVCQLSTNDATMKKNLGEVSASFVKESFNTKTVAGAIEYIIAYVKETWNCPVIFYTGTKYESEWYPKMIDLLYEIQKKWNIGIIDLWNDEAMNRVDPKDYRRYMVNGIHPSKAGYLEWWTPKMEEKLVTLLG